MPYNIIAEVEGVEALKRKFAGLDKPVTWLIREAGAFAQRKTAEYAKPPGATGGLAHGITLSIGAVGQPLAAKGQPLSAKIYPHRRIAGIAWTVEEGRRPGRPPPLTPIHRWAMRRGFLGPADIGQAWKLTQDIGRRGTKGLYMFKRAAQDTERKIGELVKKAARDIEARFGR